MTGLMNHGGFLPVVHELEDQRKFLPPQRASFPLALNDFMGLAEALIEGGYDIGAVLTKIGAVRDALDAALVLDEGKYLTADLLSMEPQAVAEALRQAGLDMAAHEQMSRVHTQYDGRLAKAAAANLKAESNRIIAAMRKRFEPALKVVRTAVEAGLTPSSEPAALLASAPQNVIDAYRALGPAVAELDRITALRNQMTSTAGVGPSEHLMCGIVTGLRDMQHLEGAQNVWRGVVERVQFNVPNGSGASHPARRTRYRLGGPWLALLLSGYDVRLNTGTEADAVLAAAEAGGE